MTLSRELFHSARMDAAFSDERRLQRMLDFEAALAVVEAELGVIPEDAARAIQLACREQNIDRAALRRGAASAGNLAIPLVKQLTDVVAASNPAAAQSVHWGATSQDVMDTGCVLQLREGLEILESDLRELIANLSILAERHATTLMPGRTWLQHAVPITFGWKAGPKTEK